jgi:hypothetical protein
LAWGVTDASGWGLRLETCQSPQQHHVGAGYSTPALFLESCIHKQALAHNIDMEHLKYPATEEKALCLLRANEIFHIIERHENIAARIEKQSSRKFSSAKGQLHRTVNSERGSESNPPQPQQCYPHKKHSKESTFSQNSDRTAHLDSAACCRLGEPA